MYHYNPVSLAYQTVPQPTATGMLAPGQIPPTVPPGGYVPHLPPSGSIQHPYFPVTPAPAVQGIHITQPATSTLVLPTSGSQTQTGNTSEIGQSKDHETQVERFLRQLQKKDNSDVEKAAANVAHNRNDSTDESNSLRRIAMEYGAGTNVSSMDTSVAGSSDRGKSKQKTYQKYIEGILKELKADTDDGPTGRESGTKQRQLPMFSLKEEDEYVPTPIDKLRERVFPYETGRKEKPSDRYTEESHCSSSRSRSATDDRSFRDSKISNRSPPSEAKNRISDDEEDPEHYQAQVFISHLPITTTLNDMRDILKNYDKKMWLGHNKLRPNDKCVFVRASSMKEAKRLISEFNGYVFLGRSIDVRFTAAVDFQEHSLRPEDRDNPKIHYQTRSVSPLRKSRKRSISPPSYYSRRRSTSRSRSKSPESSHGRRDAHRRSPVSRHRRSRSTSRSRSHKRSRMSSGSPTGSKDTYDILNPEPLVQPYPVPGPQPFVHDPYAAPVAAAPPGFPGFVYAGPEFVYQQAPMYPAHVPSTALYLPVYRVHMGNLSPDISVDSLDVYIGSYNYSRLELDEKDGDTFALVDFNSVEEAERMMNELHGKSCFGKLMRLSFVTPADEPAKTGETGPSKEIPVEPSREIPAESPKKSLPCTQSPKDTNSLFQGYLDSEFAYAVVIGKKYVHEYMKKSIHKDSLSKSSTNKAFYVCVVCEELVIGRGIAHHVVGRHHRLKYCKRYTPWIYMRINQISDKQQMKEECCKYAEDHLVPEDTITTHYCDDPQQTASNHLKKVKETADQLKKKEKDKLESQRKKKNVDRKSSSKSSKSSSSSDSTSDIFKRLQAYKKRLEALKGTTDSNSSKDDRKDPKKGEKKSVKAEKSHQGSLQRSSSQQNEKIIDRKAELMKKKIEESERKASELQNTKNEKKIAVEDAKKRAEELMKSALKNKGGEACLNDANEKSSETIIHEKDEEEQTDNIADVQKTENVLKPEIQIVQEVEENKKQMQEINNSVSEINETEKNQIESGAMKALSEERRKQIAEEHRQNVLKKAMKKAEDEQEKVLKSAKRKALKEIRKKEDELLKQDWINRTREEIAQRKLRDKQLAEEREKQLNAELDEMKRIREEEKELLEKLKAAEEEQKREEKLRVLAVEAGTAVKETENIEMYPEVSVMVDQSKVGASNKQQSTESGIIQLDVEQTPEIIVIDDEEMKESDQVIKTSTDAVSPIDSFSAPSAGVASDVTITATETIQSSGLPVVTAIETISSRVLPVVMASETVSSRTNRTRAMSSIVTIPLVSKEELAVRDKILKKTSELKPQPYGPGMVLCSDPNSKLQEVLRSTPGALEPGMTVGLQWVVETAFTSSKKDGPVNYRYKCILCGAHSDAKSFVSHLQSLKHKVKYLEKKYPKALKKMKAHKINVSRENVCQRLKVLEMNEEVPQFITLNQNEFKIYRKMMKEHLVGPSCLESWVPSIADNVSNVSQSPSIVTVATASRATSCPSQSPSVVTMSTASSTVSNALQSPSVVTLATASSQVSNMSRSLSVVTMATASSTVSNTSQSPSVVTLATGFSSGSNTSQSPSVVTVAIASSSKKTGTLQSEKPEISREILKTEKTTSVKEVIIDLTGTSDYSPTQGTENKGQHAETKSTETVKSLPKETLPSGSVTSVSKTPTSKKEQKHAADLLLKEALVLAFYVPLEDGRHWVQYYQSSWFNWNYSRGVYPLGLSYITEVQSLSEGPVYRCDLCPQVTLTTCRDVCSHLCLGQPHSLTYLATVYKDRRPKFRLCQDYNTKVSFLRDLAKEHFDKHGLDPIRVAIVFRDGFEESVRKKAVEAVYLAEHVDIENKEKAVTFYTYPVVKENKMIGLSYVTELQGLPGGAKFRCDLCVTQWFSVFDDIHEHIRSTHHISAFLRQHNMAILQSVKELGDDRTQRLREIAETLIEGKRLEAIKLAVIEDENKGEPISNLYTMIQESGNTDVVGLGFILELQSVDVTAGSIYECKLCNTTVTDELIVSHIYGAHHKYKFLKVRFPDLLKKCTGKIQKADMFVSEIIGQYGWDPVSVKKIKCSGPDGSPVYEKQVTIPVPFVQKSTPMEESLWLTKVEAMDAAFNDEEMKRKTTATVVQTVSVQKPAQTAVKIVEPQKTLRKEAVASVPTGKKQKDFEDIIVGLDYTPLLGIEFMQELKHPTDAVPPFFECNLCNLVREKCQLLSQFNVIKHICTRGHRMNYFWKTDRAWCKEMELTNQMRSRLDNQTKIESSKKPRQKMKKMVIKDEASWRRIALKAFNRPATKTESATKVASDEAEQMEAAPTLVLDTAVTMETSAEPVMVVDVSQYVIVKKPSRWEDLTGMIDTNMASGELIEAKNVRSLLEQQDPGNQARILGLRKVSEVQVTSNWSAAPWYICHLCFKSALTKRKLLQHCQNHQHSLRYIEQQHPEILYRLKDKKLTSSGLKKSLLSITTEILRAEMAQDSASSPQVLLDTSGKFTAFATQLNKHFEESSQSLNAPGSSGNPSTQGPQDHAIVSQFSGHIKQQFEASSKPPSVHVGAGEKRKADDIWKELESKRLKESKQVKGSSAKRVQKISTDGGKGKGDDAKSNEGQKAGSSGKMDSRSGGKDSSRSSRGRDDRDSRLDKTYHKSREDADRRKHRDDRSARRSGSSREYSKDDKYSRKPGQDGAKKTDSNKDKDRQEKDKEAVDEDKDKKTAANSERAEKETEEKLMDISSDEDDGDFQAFLLNELGEDFVTVDEVNEDQETSLEEPVAAELAQNDAAAHTILDGSSEITKEVTDKAAPFSKSDVVEPKAGPTDKSDISETQSTGASSPENEQEIEIRSDATNKDDIIAAKTSNQDEQVSETIEKSYNSDSDKNIDKTTEKTTAEPAKKSNPFNDSCRPIHSTMAYQSDKVVESTECNEDPTDEASIELDLTIAVGDASAEAVTTADDNFDSDDDDVDISIQNWNDFVCLDDDDDSFEGEYQEMEVNTDEDENIGADNINIPSTSPDKCLSASAQGTSGMRDDTFDGTQVECTLELESDDEERSVQKHEMEGDDGLADASGVSCTQTDETVTPAMQKVLVFGHSVVKGLRDYYQKDGKQSFASSLLQFSGFPGAKVSDLRANLQVVSEFNPDIVILMIGGNDLANASVNPAVVAKSVCDLADKLVLSSKVHQVVVNEEFYRQQTLGHSKCSVDPVWFNDRVDEYNSLLGNRLLKAHHGRSMFWQVRDFTSGLGKTRFFVSDGYRLNALGNICLLRSLTRMITTAEKRIKATDSKSSSALKNESTLEIETGEEEEEDDN